MFFVKLKSQNRLLFLAIIILRFLLIFQGLCFKGNWLFRAKLEISLICCLMAIIEMHICPMLVRSRQSTQLVLRTPLCSRITESRLFSVLICGFSTSSLSVFLSTRLLDILFCLAQKRSFPKNSFNKSMIIFDLPLSILI